MPTGPSPYHPPGEGTKRGRARGAVAAALFAGTLLLYAPVATHPFIYFDDNRYVTENPIVRQGLTWRGLAWAFGTLHASNYHPLTWLSHMLDVQLFGLHAGAHHLVNALLHALCAALLFLLLARTTRAPGRSAAAAALFALHPLHVEPVAWIAERKELLAALFGLLALLAYARHAERPSRRRLALVALPFGLSLLAKPMWVTLPFLLLLLDRWPLDRLRGDRGRLLLEKAPLLLLSAASSAVTVLAQARGGALSGLELGLGPRVANALVACVRYLGKTVWPWPLSVYYPYPRDGLPAREVLAAAALLAALTALALLQLRRRPWLAVGWLWFLGTLVPVIGLVQVGDQAMADRYAYLPTIGLFVAAAWGAEELLGRWRGGLPLRAGTAALLGLLATLTWRQLGFWSSHEALFRHAIAVEESGLAHAVLSEGLRHDGRPAEALDEARRAVQLSPGTPRHWNNLAVSLRDVGRLPEERDALAQALRIEPTYAMAWSNLAEVELRLGDLRAAEAAGEQATRLAPGEAQGWYRLGAARDAEGRADGAEAAYREAVRLKPDYAAAWNALAILLQGAGRTVEAGEAFEASARAEPGNPVTWRNLGVFLFRGGRAGEAVRAFGEALRLEPGDPDLLLRLGLAELADGQRAGALELAARLDGIDPDRAAALRRAASAR